MKRGTLTFIFLAFYSLHSFSQQDSALYRRLDTMIHATQMMETEKILDYTYPRLFSFVSREDMKTALEQMYETDDFTTTLDSIRVITVFPIFEINKGLYAMIKHSMLMRMRFKEVVDSARAASMTQLIETDYGKGSVRFEKSNNTFNISMIAEMVAIKNEFAQEWSFVNYDSKNGMADLLFSKEVLEKLKKYNQ